MTTVDLAAAEEMLATAAALGEPIPVPAGTSVYLGFQFIDDSRFPGMDTLTLSQEGTDILTRLMTFDNYLEFGEGPWLESVPKEILQGKDDPWPDVARAAREWVTTPGNLSALTSRTHPVGVDRYVVQGRTPASGSDPLTDAARLLAAHGATIPGATVYLATLSTENYSLSTRIVAACTDVDAAEEALARATVLATISAGYIPWLDPEVWAEDKRLDYEHLCAVDGTLDTLVEVGIDFVFANCGGVTEFVQDFDIPLPGDALPEILEISLSDPDIKMAEVLTELDEAARGA